VAEVELELEKVSSALNEIRAEMFEAVERFRPDWSEIPSQRRRSAQNLLHYLALRKRDLRPLQDQLAALGLSSLGRAESQALANVQAVLDLVRQLASKMGNGTHANGFADGRALLDAHTRDLLGPDPVGRTVRIMVTMPGEAGERYELVRDLVAAGMDCMRINTAHDHADVWERMIANVERARVELRRPCRVLVDLAGPKLRTGSVAPGPPVVHWRPRRDLMGRVVSPARIWLTPGENPHAAKDRADATLPVAGEWLAGLAVGDTIKLFDARDSMRTMRVSGRTDGGVWAESHQSAYVLPGTTLQLTHGAFQPAVSMPRHGTVGALPATAQDILLAPGDSLLITREPVDGHPASVAADGTLEPARISLTLPEIFDDVLAGESMWLDDGKIGGVIRSVTREHIEVTITHAKPSGSKLGTDKGINLPDSNLRLPALTSKDLADLPFIAKRADLVGQSFVRTASDVRELQVQLATLGSRDLGIVLKIETRRAFENLPALLLAAMRSPSSGVMIARGDLAVECGYERLAEVQEEILWMAEASHMPVIWATQVLESLAKDGRPSRAEVTDAAMGERAECVMLNKGPYILDAVATLDNILRRMQTHQRKKSAMLRDLHLAERFFDPLMR
jgi:pyruvate kinase